ncbi:hypothetical protein V1478_009365 [Vespula squamosa]|uniref:Uncharacterized protein n=1 Tax=Vespula squamosa TaxID=30214 RepID=A0ABD2APF9_VESSQ
MITKYFDELHIINCKRDDDDEDDMKIKTFTTLVLVHQQRRNKSNSCKNQSNLMVTSLSRVGLRPEGLRDCIKKQET